MLEIPMNQEDHLDVEENSELHIGLIHVDMLGITVPVFDCLKQMQDGLFERGYTFEGDILDGPACDGMVVQMTAPNGNSGWAVYLEPDTSNGIWVHEASHLTYYIFNLLGVPAGCESTEFRAYLTQWIYEQLHEIVVSRLMLQQQVQTLDSTVH
jgi:hypothetical protein